MGRHLLARLRAALPDDAALAHAPQVRARHLTAGAWVADRAGEADTVSPRDFHSGTMAEVWEELPPGGTPPAAPAPRAATLWTAARAEWRVGTDG